MDGTVKVATLAWGLGFLAAGFAISWGTAPGSGGTRYGMAAFLVVLGLLLLSSPVMRLVARRSARVEGASGGACPVGASCTCGHFNFKPRKTCRACGKATLYPS